MWIGVVWILIGPWGASLSCGIIGWWKREECVGAYTVVVTFRNVVDRSVWAFVGVYGLNLDRDRRLLWDELAGVLSLWNLLWCLGGDFNVTQFLSERLGTAHLDHAMMEFYKG